jgi:hypothetical protein
VTGVSIGLRGGIPVLGLPLSENVALTELRLAVGGGGRCAEALVVADRASRKLGDLAEGALAALSGLD